MNREISPPKSGKPDSALKEPPTFSSYLPSANNYFRAAKVSSQSDPKMWGQSMWYAIHSIAIEMADENRSKEEKEMVMRYLVEMDKRIKEGKARDRESFLNKGRR